MKIFHQIVSIFYQIVSRLSIEKLRFLKNFSNSISFKIYSDFKEKSISFSIDFMSTFYQKALHLSIEKFFNFQETFSFSLSFKLKILL